MPSGSRKKNRNATQQGLKGGAAMGWGSTCRGLRSVPQDHGLAGPPRRDLGRQFSVEHLPTVVVLKPGGDVLTRDATDEIQRLGPACFANWQEAAEVLDRNFLLPEDLDDPAPRSLVEPLRRRKYRVDEETRGGRGPEGRAPF
ncbi:Hypothetical predicted protein [Marmota monax]|uniref:Thioredoxin-like fold domain-containing protein n=1 Tax=Marmota monax TaxID=9995 RepID=A0A5E4ACH2_MARMO|nr:hypothetical protein GHT09_010496 [Marmota monax]VTJ54765.1 Hypothetical predicted protein [Marmota monax]